MKRKLALYTGILTYFLIVFGGYVASSESGMGCGPEWPLCNGAVIPELHGETLIEFGHRFIGAVVFIFTMILYFIIKMDGSAFAKKVASWMVVLLIIQLIAGAIVVFYHLPSVIITIHLLIAMVFLGILIWFWRDEERKWFEARRNDPIKIHLNALIVLLLLTIVVGAYVKHEYYGLACGWLTCGDTFFPSSIAGFVQTFHRLLAFISVFFTVFVTYRAFQIRDNRLIRRMLLALGIIFIQVIIGIMTILTSISITFAVWHLAAATLVFAIIMEARIMVRPLS